MIHCQPVGYGNSRPSPLANFAYKVNNHFPSRLTVGNVVTATDITVGKHAVFQRPYINDTTERPNRMNATELPTLMTEDEVVNYLNCTPSTIRRYRKEGKLPVVGTYTKPTGHIVPVFASADALAL